MERECAICLSGITDDQETYSHNVEGSASVHEFHKACMGEWAAGTTMARQTIVTCPTCRKPLGEKNRMIEQLLGRGRVYRDVARQEREDQLEEEVAQMGNEQARRRLMRHRMGIPPALDVPIEILACFAPVHGEANRNRGYDYTNAMLYGFHAFGTLPLVSGLITGDISPSYIATAIGHGMVGGVGSYVGYRLFTSFFDPPHIHRARMRAAEERLARFGGRKSRKSNNKSKKRRKSRRQRGGGLDIKEGNVDFASEESIIEFLKELIKVIKEEKPFFLQLEGNTEVIKSVLKTLGVKDNQMVTSKI